MALMVARDKKERQVVPEALDQLDLLDHLVAMALMVTKDKKEQLVA